jgi:predicted metalloendopeptidase
LAALELTHGFDGLGAKYDERDTLRDWWSQTIAKNFPTRSAPRVRARRYYED